MFGYLRPAQGELKVRELERFKACYCGLCRTLGKKYGQTARFVLSYELVFLSMLLWGEDDPVAIRSGRCMASPCRKKRYCAPNKAMGDCAGYNVVLSWWKLRDTIEDAGVFRALPYRMLALLLRRAYRKASRDHPYFDTAVRKHLGQLAGVEAGAEATLDSSADKFALILRSVAETAAQEPEQRPLGELLYHLGRWIYILDACDDYADDVSAKRYNPVALRFPPENGALPADGKDRVATTLAHSNNLVCSAFELLPENAWSQVVRNTIYLGMPDVCMHVMNGTWPVKRLN